MLNRFSLNLSSKNSPPYRALKALNLTPEQVKTKAATLKTSLSLELPQHTFLNLLFIGSFFLGWVLVISITFTELIMHLYLNHNKLLPKCTTYFHDSMPFLECLILRSPPLFLTNFQAYFTILQESTKISSQKSLLKRVTLGCCLGT